MKCDWKTVKIDISNTHELRLIDFQVASRRGFWVSYKDSPDGDWVSEPGYYLMYGDFFASTDEIHGGERGACIDELGCWDSLKRSWASSGMREHVQDLLDELPEPVPPDVTNVDICLMWLDLYDSGYFGPIA